MRISWTSVLVTVALLAGAVRAEVYKVGPHRQIKSLSQIAGRLKPGDVVEMDPYIYNEPLRVNSHGTKEKPITIRCWSSGLPADKDAEGVETPRGVAVFDGRGLNVFALCDIQGDNVYVQGLIIDHAGPNTKPLWINGRNCTILISGHILSGRGGSWDGPRRAGDDDGFTMIGYQPRDAKGEIPRAKEWARPVYHIGPKRKFRSLAEVADVIPSGATIELDPGTYREPVTVSAKGTLERPVVIRGPAGKDRPVFDLRGVKDKDGKPASAAFTLTGSNIRLQRLEITGVSGPCVELKDSENVVIRDCYLHHSHMGVAGSDEGTVLIEDSEIAFNGLAAARGRTHNVSLAGNRVFVRNCYIHDAPFGQNFVSRAAYNELTCNWIADSAEGEVSALDGRKQAHKTSQAINRNTVLCGNVIVSGPRKGSPDPNRFILFGSDLPEGESTGHCGALFLFHNTFVAGTGEVVFVELADAKARLLAENNIFHGSDYLLWASPPALSLDGRCNLVAASAQVPEQFKVSVKGEARFVDPAKRDYRLADHSPAIDAGTMSTRYVDAGGNSRLFLPSSSPWPGMRESPRKGVGRPDIGAYEKGAAPATQPE